MRGFKTLWRLALNKDRTRSERKGAEPVPSRQSDPASRDMQEQTARLLGAEPPTRTLQ